MFPLASSITDLDAGRVQKTSLVPAGKFTAESLLDEDMIVVLAKVHFQSLMKKFQNLLLLLQE